MLEPNCLATGKTPGGMCDGTYRLRLVAPADGTVVPTLGYGQKAFLAMPRDDRLKYFADQNRRAELKELGCWPKPVRLIWTYVADDSGKCGDVSAKSGRDVTYDVQVVRLRDAKVVFKTALISSVPTNSVAIDNLEIACQYQWKVVADNRDVAIATFTTQDRAPRLLRIPGVPNFRDLGGRVGLDGRRVRQGLVFRSARLNGNGVAVYYTPEERLTLDPSLKVRKDAADGLIGVWKKREANPELMKFVSATLSPLWTVFISDEETFNADGEAALSGTASLPDEFLGSKAEYLQLPEGESRFFKKTKGKKEVAVLMQEVVASDDGFMRVGAGGDYWWELRVNGEKVFDLMRAGNWRGPYNPGNYCFAVPVKRGVNLVAVAIRAGNATWSWGWTSAADEPPARFAHDHHRALQHDIDSYFYGIVKRWEKGEDFLVPEARSYMTDVLGIRSDIDLRSGNECVGMNGSPLGESVRWFHYSSSAYAEMQEDFGMEAFANVFRVFLDPSNYPVVFHCSGGQDRTGCVAFILNGLLGVDIEELYLDWEVSGFWNANVDFRHDHYFDRLIQGFQRFAGKTINEKIEKYVLSLGFTQTDISTFRSIMLGATKCAIMLP